MLKEVVVAYANYCPSICLKDLKKPTIILSQESQSSGQNLN
jgi:hypothetical protein